MRRIIRDLAVGLLALTGTFSGAMAQGPAPAPVAATPAKTAAILPAAPVGSVPLTKADADAWLDGLMPYALARADIAGAVVVIVKDGQILTQRGFGFSDVAKRTPVSPQTTLFRPGSVSKLFTWTAVMQLVEQGKVDLDADVNKYIDFKIPDYQGKPVTLRQIMTHTSGFDESARYLISPNPNDHLPLGEVLKRSLPVRVYAPGSTPSYSNYATALAGYVVERVSGQPFDDYLDAHIFKPLDMQHATFRQPLPPALAPLMSKGYKTAGTDAKPFEFVLPAPAGSLSASGEDMGKFMLAHLANGAGLLKPETAAMMHDYRAPGVGPLNTMALGFYEQHANGHRAIGHGGDTQWFHSLLMLFPDSNTGFFLSINSLGDPGAAGSLRNALFHQFANRYLAPVPLEPAQKLDEKTRREHGALLAGNYANSRGGVASFMAATGLLGQTKISVDDKGQVTSASFNGFGREPVKWVEVAPFVWRDPLTGERLAAKVENGRVVRASIDQISPFMVLNPVHWTVDAKWLVPAISAALGLVALTALAWPAGAIARRRHGVAFPLTGRDRRVFRITHALAWLALAIFAGWATLITLMFADLANLGGKLDWLLYTLQILTPVVLVAFLGFAIWNLLLIWRRNSGWGSRLWGVLVVLSAIIFLWFAWFGKLIGFGTVY
ncbi:serine hydrolase domain-containing protein [Sandaracinobacteroides hominis]|uniref:serine hydrolase domain-containing protein n=1 Tax=Sandaracinobacteroides hominis TaxID=2780086 RepID=UPI001F1E0CDA|nr:serine hydrolase domain-containing protein [Sandaracinobacteroides hominis]